MREQLWFPWLAGVLLVGGGCARAGSAAGAWDSFVDPAAWTVIASDGVVARVLRPEDGAQPGLGLEFEFSGGGYVVLRQEIPRELAPNYEFSFRVRGPAPTNHLEFKLVDPSGDNVWWSVRRDFEFGTEWRRVRVKRRHLEFAWGPSGGAEIERIGAIEIAITAGTGGAGTVFFDDLTFRELPVAPAVPVDPRAMASSERGGSPAASVLDGDDSTAWSPAPEDADPSLTLDLGVAGREFGALGLVWGSGGHPRRYSVEISDDGEGWEAIRIVEGGNGGHDALYLPEQEARYLRVRVGAPSGQGGIALAAVTIEPPEIGASREAFFARLAAAAPRGSYPRGLLDEQTFWTVVGLDGGETAALLGEDGALEPRPGGFSIEPFATLDGRLFTWADVRAEASLDQGSLPIPTVTWSTPTLRMDITAFATRADGVPVIVLRYELTNGSETPSSPSLHLAVRPFQVNPPSQTLNLRGGTARIRRIAVHGQSLTVDGHLALDVHAPPTAAGVSSFDGGDVVVDHLRYGRVPERASVDDPFAAASGVFSFALPLGPGESREITAIVPLEPTLRVARPGDPARWVETEHARARAEWKEKVGRVRFELPPEATALRQTFEAQIAYVLVNRAGPAIQPGTRSYARSWIRDGALTSSALLRVGHAEAAASFLRWYAPYQYPDGKIPCVVDWRGADPVPEHDSNGEFIFLTAEVYRHTRDRGLAEEMWPRVRKAVDYLVALRNERLGPEWDQPETRHFRGLLPPSISHEGYSAKPMHSYWDDFFARRGFADAAFLAAALGLMAEQARIDSVLAAFEGDLRASVERAMEVHGIDFVPGCADLGDFDATSTTIALSPTGAAAALPPGALERTFERYGEFFRARRDGDPWEAFTPYEIRNVGAFVRLDRPGEAHEILDWMLGQQRPAGWRQWPEVVRSDLRAAGFLGDLPHTWVGSDYLRSVIDLFAIESGDRLEIGRGVPASWRDAASGVGIHDLRTSFGTISWTVRPEGGGGFRLTIEGDASPPGGIVLAFPWIAEFSGIQATEGGLARSPAGELVVEALPAALSLRP